jgi:hypothetical protein
MNNPTVGYRVEHIDGRWHLFFIKQDGFEFFFHDYEDEVTAKYLGIRGSERPPQTEDGWRARRRQMRAV